MGVGGRGLGGASVDGDWKKATNHADIRREHFQLPLKDCLTQYPFWNERTPASSFQIKSTQ